MKEEDQKDSKAEFYMQMWFKSYNKFRYRKASIWINNIDEFKQKFRDAGFDIEEPTHPDIPVSIMTHPKLEGKEHRWQFREAGYCMITNNYITLYRMDGVEDYLSHVKDLLK